ncbi:MAG: hypothetical protein NT001_05440 [Candidatus Woesearchaeota archaeon]|nr:hypothetical protein [Candidatus Woesearchaeota archaeon]
MALLLIAKLIVARTMETLAQQMVNVNQLIALATFALQLKVQIAALMLTVTTAIPKQKINVM